MCPKTADVTENSVNSDHTAPLKAVSSAFALFTDTYLSEYLDVYSKIKVTNL